MAWAVIIATSGQRPKKVAINTGINMDEYWTSIIINHGLYLNSCVNKIYQGSIKYQDSINGNILLITDAHANAISLCSFCVPFPRLNSI